MKRRTLKDRRALPQLCIATALSLCVTFVMSSAAFAQRAPDKKAPIKWGKIPQEHLTMDHYAADSNATAVILADYGDVYFRDDYSIAYERHTRIKILSEGGYDWATVSIPYRAEDGLEKVHGVKGQTFTRGPNGKAMRHKMDKKVIFTEDLDGSYKRVRFTLPALEPGAVIEYTYRVDARSPLFLPDWTFQHSEPTLWSEYRLETVPRFNYVRATIGRHPFAVEESEELKAARVVRNRWAMQDVPALREERFMTTPEDYRAAIRFQLSAYVDPSVGWVNYLTSWEEVATELMAMPLFGDRIRPSRAIRQQTEAVTAGLENPREKMEAIYDYVRTTVTWDGVYHAIAEERLDNVLKTQRGNSGEMALLLVSMLRAAGLEAHPVLISTRSHGRVLEAYPLLSQFNATLAAALVGGQTYLLDATDPLRPYTLLPTEALNGRGWLVREKNPAWIPIEAAGTYQHKVYLDVALDASGTLSGQIYTTDGGYSALDKRWELRETDSPEGFVKDVVFGSSELQVDSCAVINEETVTEAFKTEAAFSVPGYAAVAGDLIYFNPMPVGRLAENPLRLTQRTFPVDLAYPRNHSHTMRLTLPEGYAVQELPKKIQTRLPVDGGHFQRAVNTQDNVLTVQTHLVIKRSIFDPKHYTYLRSFYEQIVAAGAEQVVLKRVDASAGGAEEDGKQ